MVFYLPLTREVTQHTGHVHLFCSICAQACFCPLMERACQIHLKTWRVCSCGCWHLEPLCMVGAARGAAAGNQSLLDMIPACSSCRLHTAELQHLWSTAGSCRGGFCLGLQLFLICPQPLPIRAGSSILVIPLSSSQRCQLSALCSAFPWPPAPAAARFLPTECLQVTQWPKHSQAAP